ncbi:pseudaminic acid synthase [Arthrobacter sp. UM1]|uniref:pseudaminic acid synthase n=1 Tax=Arthrobacter sp. UM1 TaxID=2766776 RepID=UPI001CF628BF|nr:pseudaminic acid synthase [Arthrobacter sp. UM1]MCB4207753.1 pseudaminic acid synthase [Arthrobacter sp. UM1]
MTQRTYTAGQARIGTDAEPFIIAEVSGNHNGDLQRALDIIDMVAEQGAQAVKFQTYTADTITIDSKKPAFMISEGHELWGGQNLYQLYTEAHTPWDWHEAMFERARSKGLIPFSSPFDATAVDLLESLDADLYKIASLEIGDLPLLRRVAQTGKPVILSNGAASITDIDRAVQTIRAEGNDQIVVLACTSSYPASPAESNLRTIPVMRDAFDVQVGLSDHTMGIGAAVAAVALGATVIEKHVTLSRADGGVDSDFSLEPHELKSLVDESKVAWQALGSPHLTVTAGEGESQRLRRSLWVTEDVKKGEKATPENVRSIRPAGGLTPGYTEVVMGREFTQDAEAGTPVTWEII